MKLLSVFYQASSIGKLKIGERPASYEERQLKRLDAMPASPSLHVRLFTKALKASWVKKYLDSENFAKWKLFVDSQVQIFGGDLFFKANLHKKDLEFFFQDIGPFLNCKR